jgi:hypothetical protein
VARVGGRWRLFGSLALPAAVGPEVTARILLERLVAAEPGLTGWIGLHPARIDDLATVTVRSHPPGRLAVVAASERALAPLLAVAERSGWRATGASPETADPLAMTRLLLEPDVAAVLAGAGDPPGADERGALDEVGIVVAAAAGRRPAMPVILAGAMADGLRHFGDVASRSGEVLLGPAVGGGGEGAPLHELLTETALPDDDARRALGRAAGSLADVLDRRLEIFEIGHDAGTRIVATPGAGGDTAAVDLAVVPAAGLVPRDHDEATVDAVLGWATVPSDRHRMRDRLRELRSAPWADPAGDGALIRAAAARAAVGRLIAATPDFDRRPAPDLVVAAGGAWSVHPAQAIPLAIADVVRRAGASQYALDHARLLAPLGSIPDARERRDVIADLVDELLVPLGSVVTPSGLHQGHGAGHLTIHIPSAARDVDLVPGGIEHIDLAAGETAIAEFRFRDRVSLGTRGRHFAVDVAGGLGGLLVDLRDVPLRLPERHERRREVLGAWQDLVWAGRDT